jgi:hypothetical protein
MSPRRAWFSFTAAFLAGVGTLGCSSITGESSTPDAALAKQPPLWLTVRLDTQCSGGTIIQIPVQPAIEFQRTFHGNGVQNTISGKLRLVDGKYVGDLKIAEYVGKLGSEGTFELELDLDEPYVQGEIASICISRTFVLSRSPDRWRNVGRFGEPNENSEAPRATYLDK